jgi:hypothetical protein
MTEPRNPRGIIRRDAVRLQSQAAQLDCAAGAGRTSHALAVVPLVDDGRVAGFEIRCGCGASAVVECVYEES